MLPLRRCDASDKGAPSARHAYGLGQATRAGASSRGVARAAGMTGHQRAGPSGVSPLRAAASLASFGRELLSRTAPPPPAATSPRRNAPVPAPHEQNQADMLTPSA